jgi:DNA-binding NarL/FixJ family response regulator
VLIVEDDFLLADELARLLRERGYRVLGPVPSAPGACAVLRWHNPAAALLDVNLSGEMVTPVAAMLAEAGVPFAVVTGYGAADLGEPLLQEAPRLGKPYDEAGLLRLLDGLLASDASSPASSPDEPGT